MTKLFTFALYSIYIGILNAYYIHCAIPSFGFDGLILRYLSRGLQSTFIYLSLLVIIKNIFGQKKKNLKYFLLPLFFIYILLPELTFLIEKFYLLESAQWEELAYLFMQTNPSEANEAVGIGRPILITLILISSFLIHLKIFKSLDLFLPKKYTIGLTLLALSSFLLPEINKTFFPNRFGLYSTSYFKHYLSEIDRVTNLNDNIRENIKKRSLEVTNKDSKEEKKNFVLIIGESLTKKRMSLYDYKKIKTNPRLSKRELIKFENSYSNHVWTVKALSLALTEANQYNQLDYFSANTIVDLANRSDIKTHWYSNQSTHGRMNAMITVIAKDADNTRFSIENTTGVSDFQDSVLLDMMSEDIKNKVLSSNDANLIVVHLIGNHFLYCNRFPNDFMPDLKAASHEECYDKSVLFNDKVVDDIINKLSKFSGKTPLGVFYFSDHGINFDENSDLGESKRMVSNYKPAMAEIPVIFWANDPYNKKYPEIIKNLKKNKNKVYTNDLVFNTLAGLLNLKYGEGSFDVTSKDYNISTPLTNHGKHKL